MNPSDPTREELGAMIINREKHADDWHARINKIRERKLVYESVADIGADPETGTIYTPLQVSKIRNAAQKIQQQIDKELDQLREYDEETDRLHDQIDRRFRPTILSRIGNAIGTVSMLWIGTKAINHWDQKPQ